MAIVDFSLVQHESYWSGLSDQDLFECLLFEIENVIKFHEWACTLK